MLLRWFFDNPYHVANFNPWILRILKGEKPKQG